MGKDKKIELTFSNHGWYDVEYQNQVIARIAVGGSGYKLGRIRFLDAGAEFDAETYQAVLDAYHEKKMKLAKYKAKELWNHTKEELDHVRTQIDEGPANELHQAELDAKDQALTSQIRTLKGLCEAPGRYLSLPSQGLPLAILIQAE